MKVISLLPGTTEVSIQELPEPEIVNPKDVKLKVMQVGICGTDREETSGGRADAPKGEKKLVIGHEMLGKIVECGKDVKSVSVGEFAVVTVRRGCGKCDACNAGANHMCYTGAYTERGIKERHGFQAEFVVDSEDNLIKIPKEIADIAVLTEPMSVVQKAIDESGKLQQHRLPWIKSEEEWFKGKTALIAGLGPIGLLAAIALRLRGMEVIGMDIVDENSSRPQILKALGGKYLNGKGVTMKEIFNHCDRVDLILEAAGIPKLDFDLINALATNGIYVLTGVPADGPPLNFDGATIMRQLVLKNQVIFGSVNAGKEHFTRGVQDLGDAVKKWGDIIPRLITKKVHYTNYHEAFFKHEADEIKVVVNWE